MDKELKGRGHAEDPGVDENVMLIRIKKKCVGVHGLHLSSSGQCPLSGELL
jgi:hypothetical protein